MAIHQLATIVWIGGMFFAHFALRRAAEDTLEPPQRLPMLLLVFSRFFVWVWIAILALWASGLWIFSGIYSGNVGWHVHAMMLIALVMSAIFAYIFFVPYRRLGLCVDAGDWPGARQRVAVIRQLIGLNLTLGLLTAVLGSAGRYLQ